MIHYNIEKNSMAGMWDMIRYRIETLFQCKKNMHKIDSKFRFFAI